MENKKGLFIVFEGIDGSGKTTQIEKLGNYIRKLDKYQDVLLTREPTFRAKELKTELDKSSDAFSDAEKMARLFVEDRKIHTQEEILPALNQKVFVLSDRYSISTCAYQSAQGLDIDLLLKMHDCKEIIPPDLTFYVNVSKKVAEERMLKRGTRVEKFEGNSNFTEKLIFQHNLAYVMSWEKGLASKVLGKVININGEQSEEKVFEDIKEVFDKVYRFGKFPDSVYY